MLTNITRRLNGCPQNDNSDDTGIDITPLLDVVFIVLIFFIVTASFARESGIGINKPASDHALINPPSSLPIVLDINANNEISIQGIPLPETAIRATIVRLKAELPESQVLVTLHPKVRTAAMISALDKLRSAKIFKPSVRLVPS